jgi:hypothetical protein
VPEQFLHGPDVVAVLEEVRGEGVTQGVGTAALGDGGLPHRSLHCALQDRLVEVVATDL